MKMKGILAGLAMMVVGFHAVAADLETYESQQFNVKFDLPASWNVEVDENTLVAAPEEGGISFVVVAYQDREIGTQQLFETFVNDIGLEAEGEYEEIPDFNGFHAYMGNGVAEIDGETVAVIAVALTLGDNNVVAYIFCAADRAEANQELMTEILVSIAPLR